MTQFPIDELSRVPKLGPKLAAECYHRYQDFHVKDNQPLQVILAYTGVVLRNISPKDPTEENSPLPQRHACLVSGCYGLFHLSDLIEPYRMEFDIEIPEPGNGNMYTFWEGRQTNILIHDVRRGDRILLDLASLNIQPSFQWKGMERSIRIIIPEFKVWKNGKTEMIAIYAKMRRGQASRCLIESRVSDPEALRALSWKGFTHKENVSGGDNWAFL